MTDDPTVAVSAVVAANMRLLRKRDRWSIRELADRACGAEA